MRYVLRKRETKEGIDEKDHGISLLKQREGGSVVPKGRDPLYFLSQDQDQRRHQ